MSERSLIRFIRQLSARGVSTEQLRKSIGDDCAIWKPKTSFDTIVTTDQLVENVHYRSDDPGRSVGARLVGRGLSDIAAMGGEARLIFLNLAWPADLYPNWCEAFLRGFGAEAKRWNVAWAGGDVSSTSGPAVASVTVIGEVPEGEALLRSGARPDDLLYVSGKLGSNPNPIIPRLALGQLLRQEKLATACMDLSDGLSTDLHHICEESKVGATVESARIPREQWASVPVALNSGEDYELLFTAHPDTRIPEKLAGVQITQIGRMTKKRAVLLDGRRLEPLGWEHFR